MTVRRALVYHGTLIPVRMTLTILAEWACVRFPDLVKSPSGNLSLANRAGGSKMTPGEMNRLHREISGSGVIAKAEALGRALIDVRADLDGGSFGKWIADNLSFTKRQAYKYITIAEHAEVASGAVSIREALELIDRANEPDVSPEGPPASPEDHPEDETEGEEPDRPGFLRTRGFQDWQTPYPAVVQLVDWLPPPDRTGVIWEPCCGNGNIVQVLRDAGRPVLGTDIKTGTDFLTADPPEGTGAIVTNPPYDLKDQFLARCYALGFPFALLLPLCSLGGSGRSELYRRNGVGVLVIPNRVAYQNPDGSPGKGIGFESAWFTWKLGIPSGAVRFANRV